MKKKILVIILAAILALGIIPASIFAESSGYLSELAFGSAMAATNKDNYALSPAFNPDIHKYTVFVGDNVSALYAWATLSPAGKGKSISCKYTKTTGAANAVTLTSAKATGLSLAGIIKADNNGNTLTVAVDDQNYTVEIKRKATLSSLELLNGDAALDLNTAFAGGSFEYSAFAPKTNKLKINAVKTAESAVLTVNGKALCEETELVWSGDKAEIKIEVSYGTEATKNTYTVTVNAIKGLDGNGTEADPYLIKNASDMLTFSNLVNSGVSFNGLFIKLTSDVTLPKDWVPIGDLTEAAKTKYYDYTNAIKVKDSYPFKGTFDGDNHKITVPEGELTAFGSVFHATLKNFKIYGAKIPGYGVVQYWLQRSSSKDADNNRVIIENVTLLSGTHTMMSGFIGGYESGMDRVIIRNCTVEKGVVVGNDGKGFWSEYETAGEIKNAYSFGPTAPIYQNDFVGSFVGAASGEIIGCKSSATVLGNNYVGGIWGFKGQSMGDCFVRECYFDGEVKANGNYAGGIMGSGYASPSAPNTPCVTVQNCSCYGTVSAADYAGGIFGGEILSKQNWNNGVGYIQNNFFGGKLVCEGAHKGAVIGYFNVLDNCNIISNNFYLEGCGADKGLTLNAVETVANYVPAYEIAAGDDPESFCKKVDSEAAALAALNSGKNSSTTWKIVDGKLVCGAEKHIVSLFNASMSNNPPKFIAAFDELDEEVLIVSYNDGTTGTITVADCEKIDWNFLDKDRVGVYKPVQLVYKNAQYAFLLNNTAVIEDSAVIAADKKIAALGDISLENEDEILETINAYKALNHSQKAQLKNEGKLLAAIVKYDELKAEEAAKKAAEEAEAKRIEEAAKKKAAEEAEAKKKAEEEAAKKAAKEAEAKKAEEEAAKKAAEEAEAKKKAEEEAAKKAAEETEAKKKAEEEAAKSAKTKKIAVIAGSAVIIAAAGLLLIKKAKKNK